MSTFRWGWAGPLSHYSLLILKGGLGALFPVVFPDPLAGLLFCSCSQNVARMNTWVDKTILTCIYYKWPQDWGLAERDADTEC